MGYGVCWECSELRRHNRFLVAVLSRMAERMGSSKMPPGGAFVLAARAAVRDSQQEHEQWAETSARIDQQASI